jgi:hypothetical protein
MTERWGDVDALMRGLGSLRAAADGARATPHDRAVVEEAITVAAEAIDGMIDTPAEPRLWPPPVRRSWPLKD